VVHDWGEVVTR